jgi:hypothetical protein
MLDDNWYPSDLMVKAEGTPKTVRFMKTVYRPRNRFVYAEFGIWKADTARNVCQTFPHATLCLFDFHHNVEAAKDKLGAFPNTIHYFGNSEKYNDSYNWSLGKMLAKRKGKPVFDYCFLDGAHTFTVDALNFYLCDRLLKVGGYMDFDDYHWTLKGSSLDPAKVPAIGQQYTDEQVAAQQVRLIVDACVRTDPRYVEVVPNKVFRKIA